MHITIGHLYPHTMSTYGDIGNIICLQKRCEWRGITVTIKELEIGTPIPDTIDFYFFGGGQDAAQGVISKDLLESKAETLMLDVQKGVPLLAICGGYQLLGQSYTPFDADPLSGVGIFPIVTKASKKRMIGNIVISSNQRLSLEPKKTIVGFENHSGQTTIVDSSKAFPLGTVKTGFGNNGEDNTEGCCIYNAVGCYLHGSVLPKNPHLADYLLQKALDNSYPGTILTPLEDRSEWQTHNTIVGRYT